MDSWSKEGQGGRWTRVHRSARRALFTPFKVAGGPGKNCNLKKIRITRGKYFNNNKGFKIIDDWSVPANAHRLLESAWIGTTDFREASEYIDDDTDEEEAEAGAPPPCGGKTEAEDPPACGGNSERQNYTPTSKISWADESEAADQDDKVEKYYIGSISSLAPSSKEDERFVATLFSGGMCLRRSGSKQVLVWRPPDAIEAEVHALARGGCHPPVRRLTARGRRRPGHIRRGVIRLAGQSARNQSHRSSTYKSSSDDLSEARPRGSDGLSQADCTLKHLRPWNVSDHTAGRVVWDGGLERIRQPLTDYIYQAFGASKIVLFRAAPSGSLRIE